MRFPPLACLFFYALYHAMRAPWRVCEHTVDLCSNEFAGLRDDLSAKVTTLEGRVRDMAAQLETPLIEPEIVSYSVTGSLRAVPVPGAAGALGFGKVLVDEESLLNVLIRIENKHRISATVEKLWIEIDMNDITRRLTGSMTQSDSRPEILRGVTRVPCLSQHPMWNTEFPRAGVLTLRFPIRRLLPG